jgi:(4-(4-[2-(gamma-L-glutamylamino)ethyl]phenoxymethyl)furan-2-yl)methanamine synthase
MATVIGWDIGGANLKAALLRDGSIERIEQLAMPLWLSTEHLTAAWKAVIAGFGDPAHHAVTMTGELAEIFPSRAAGVRAIAQAAAELAGGVPVQLYAGARGFLAPGEAAAAWHDIASANWHASAAWTGRTSREAILIDIGSTTTDIIPVAGGAPAARGFTDAERLETGELVYTAVIRTSLMTLASEAPFAGRWQRLMAENFATTADVYRLTAELAPEDDSYPASDGRSKSAEDCRARLARMFGRDAGEAPDAAWDLAARFFRERQLQRIGDALAQVLSTGGIAADAPLIAAGAGLFLVPELARRFGRPAASFAALVPTRGETRRMAGVCAPAVAVALLAGGV